MLERKIDVLKAIKDGNISISSIMRYANIRFIDVKPALLLFARRGFVRLAPNGTRYKPKPGRMKEGDRCYLQMVITAKGLIFLDQWRQFQEALNSP